MSDYKVLSLDELNKRFNEQYLKNYKAAKRNKAIRKRKIALFSFVFLIFAVTFFINIFPDYSSVFRMKLYNVSTTSMEPTLKTEDIILVKPTDYAAIKSGDIITFELNAGTPTITHRVVEVYKDYQGSGEYAFQTKGDNNEEKDNFIVTQNMVRGKVLLNFKDFSKYFDSIFLTIKILLATIIAFFILIFGYKISNNIRKRKNTAVSNVHET